MEYKNGPPVFCWFNYVGLTAVTDMEWNKKEEWLIPKSELTLNEIATMTFDWHDCPNLASPGGYSGLTPD